MRFNIDIRHLCGIGIVLSAGAITPALAADNPGGGVTLADNDTVLAAWQQSAGGGAQPELVKQDDGGTTIEWHGGATLNKYTDYVSGGELLTPQTSGSYYKADVNSDLRATAPDGTTTFAQFSATNTNDRSVLSQNDTQINTLVLGQTGQSYDLRFGDTALDLSRLAGSTAGMRGMQAQKQLGSSTLVSAAAGVLVPSWEQLEHVVPRTQYLRNAYAVKLAQALGDSTQLFVVQEGYADNQGSLGNTDASLLAAASASVTTAGFNYQKNSLSVAGEAGASRWSETGQKVQDSRAYAFDASWAGQSYGLYSGYHDTGLYYTSLPGQAAPGLREMFVGGNWTAASWLSLNVDLRRSENEAADIAASGSTAVALTRTDTVAGGESITFGQQLPGLNLALNQSSSNVKNSDGTHSKTTEYAANMTYSGQVWNSGVGYDFNWVDNPVSTTSSGKTGTWTASLGANFQTSGDGAMMPEWAASMNLSGSLQHYIPAVGLDTRTSSYTVQMHVQHEQWFILDASYGEGFTTSPIPGAATVRTRTYNVSASHPFGTQNSILFYINNNGTIAGDPTQIYNQKQIGAELIYQL